MAFTPIGERVLVKPISELPSGDGKLFVGQVVNTGKRKKNDSPAVVTKGQKILFRRSDFNVSVDANTVQSIVSDWDIMGIID